MHAVQKNTPAHPKVAIITGGGAGIGRATAFRFAEEGYHVVMGDRDADDARAAEEGVRRRGREAAAVVGDVADEKHARDLAAAAMERWGRIDAFVANAGARVHGSLLDATEDDWRHIVDVNLKGVAYGCKAVLPAMREQGSGAMVIISSANALVGRADMPLYDATKAAVLSLTRSLAVAYGPEGVRVNAVCPGFTVTDFHERAAARSGISPEEIRERSRGYALLGRPAEPHEIAAAVYFLASADASNITGQTLMVDGGLSVT